jgi:hypothetical protein
VSTTVELERGVLEVPSEEVFDDDAPIEAHLYLHDSLLGTQSRAMCGLSKERDLHDAHRTHRVATWEPGMTSCPVCGAPLCVDCLLAAS